MKILTFLCYLISAILLMPYLVGAQSNTVKTQNAFTSPSQSVMSLEEEIIWLEQQYESSLTSYEEKIDEICLDNNINTNNKNLLLCVLNAKVELIDYITLQKNTTPQELKIELDEKKEIFRISQFEKFEIDKLSLELNTNNSPEISNKFEPIWPLPGYYEDWVTMTFGGVHKGYDIAAHYGENIIAVQSGTVKSADHHYSWGNNVYIIHNDIYATRYAHMSEILVEVGQYVQEGEIIGKIGSTGYSTGNHLHYEVYENSQRVDPYPFFNR